jgi:hypothetical protein
VKRRIDRREQVRRLEALVRAPTWPSGLPISEQERRVIKENLRRAVDALLEAER